MIKSSNSFIDNLSIAKKSILLIIVITLGTLLIGVSAHYGVKNMRDSYETLYRENFNPMSKLESIRRAYVIELGSILLDQGDIMAIKYVKDSGKKEWNDFIKAYYQHQDNKDDKLKLLVDSLQKEIVAFNTLIENSLELYKKEGKKSFMGLTKDQIQKELNNLDSTIDNLNIYYYKHTADVRAKSESIYNSTRKMVFLFTILSMLLAFVISLLIAKNFKKILNNLVEIIEHRNKENEKIQQSIIDRVDQAVKEARQKDQIIYQNARLASMGEMIGNIAHQWRQPLNALTLLIQSFGTKSMTGNLTQEFIDKQVEEGIRLAVSMSDTIEDFRNFFSTNREKEPFNLKDAINNTLEMSTFFLKDEHIEIVVEADEEIKIFGYSNEFSQVLLNLINNARENFKHIGMSENKKIKILLYRDEKDIILDFIDNGGGVEVGIIDRVFEPYFTTKHQSIGTGIGLYMSKQIIETQMNGSISVENIDYEFDKEIYRSAKFTIKFPHN